MLKYLRRGHLPAAALLTIVQLVAVPRAAWPHHAFAADFDAEKPVVITGKVTRLRLVNPHSWLYLDVRNSDGTVSSWGFEFGTPFGLNEKGIYKTTFPVGAVVTIKGYRSKSGQNFGYAVVTTLEDGRSFTTGGAQDAPPAPANIPKP